MKLRRMLCAMLLAALLAMPLPGLAVSRGDLMKVTHCDRWTALYRGASARSDKLAKLPKNALVVYENKGKNGYYVVRYGKKLGYVKKSCLARQSRAMRVSKTTWLHRGPDSGGKLKKLEKGAVLVGVGDFGNGYFRVCCDGQYGYVKSKYVQAAGKKQGTKAYVIGANGASLSKEPSGGERLARAALGDAVVSFGSVGKGVEYVCYDGKYGFMKSKYLEEA